MSLTLLTYDGPREERAHQRAQRLMIEAKTAADEQVQQLERALALVAELSADVAEGGEVYPVGVRDISKKISGDAMWCAQTLGSIMNQTTARKAPTPPL